MKQRGTFFPSPNHCHMEAKPLTGDLLAETERAWESQLEAFEDDEDVILVTSYRSRLNYMEEAAERDGPGFYGVVGSAGYAQAVLELTHRKGMRPQLRLLNIYLEPRLDVERRGRSKIDAREAVALITGALSEALRLTFDEHPSNELKVYARNDRMEGFLETVAVQLAAGTANVPGLSIDTEGRWLLLKKS